MEHYVGDVAGGPRRLRPRGALRHRPPEGAQQTGEPPLITLSLIVANHQLRSGERHPEAAQHLRGEQGGRRAVRGQLGRLRRQRREQGAQERVSGARRCRNHLHVNRCRL